MPRLEHAAREAAAGQRLMGPTEDATAIADLATRGMTIREIDVTAFHQPAEALWIAEARALGAERWLEAIRA